MLERRWAKLTNMQVQLETSAADENEENWSNGGVS